MTAVPSDDQYLDVSESVAVRDNAPFFGSGYDFEDYAKVIEQCISALQSSTSARQAVLETWLLVDYAVRELLSNLWGLKQFNSEDEDFDLRYGLLPSFERCIGLLERVLSIQRVLGENPDVHRVKMPIRFIHFYKKNYPDDFAKLLRIEQQYLRKYYPQAAAPEPGALPAITMGLAVTPPRHRYCVNKAWVKALHDLDEAWFGLARRLNKARNLAAHSNDANKILSAFGYAGPNAADHVKAKCEEMLSKLLGIIRKPSVGLSEPW